MSILKYWNGSTWVLVPDGSAVKYWNGSTWVVPNSVKYWNGSTWVTAWTKASPKTITLYADFATNLRHSGFGAVYDSSATAGNDAAADLFIGRYNGSQPYHFLSLIGFNSATLAAELATRPVVKSAALRLYRKPGAGYGSPAGDLVTGIWTQSNARSLPATTLSGTYNDFTPYAATSIDGWAYDTTRWFTMNGQHVLDLAAGKVLSISEVIGGFTTSGATTPAYSKIYGLAEGYNTSKMPAITVTLDYV